MDGILGSARAREKGWAMMIRLNWWRVEVVLSIRVAKRKKVTRR